MNDLISRQAAIDLVKDVCDAVMSGCESWYDTETGDEVYKDILEVDAILKCNKEVRIALRKLPSAQPERKKGEWIPEFDGKFTGGAYWFSCSKCKRIVPEVRNGGWNFCPQCGADMRGE